MTRRNLTYRRYNKPPYSYLGIMVMAIETACDRKLTLAGIHSSLRKMFPFFTEIYTGWKDSIRHNLSDKSCFYKVLRESRKSQSQKGNYWKVDLTKVPKDAFKRQTVKKECPHAWAETLHEQLGLPALVLDSTSMGKDSQTDCDSKKGVKNFKIDTILKKEVKDLEINKPLDRFPGIVDKDSSPMVTLLAETARQYHYSHTLAIENLRSLCPPANYGTPQHLHRAWTTQPTSPRQCYHHGFPLLVPTDVKHAYNPEPMDVRGTDNTHCATYQNKPTGQYGTDNTHCATYQNKPTGQYGHVEPFSHQVLQKASANFIHHETDGNLRGQTEVYGCASYVPSLERQLPFEYHDQSFVHPNQAFIHPNHSFIHMNQPFFHPVPPASTLHHTSPFSPRQTPPCYTTTSPVSEVSLEDSRSSFTSGTGQSQASPAEAPSIDENSPCSSFGGLPNMVSVAPDDVYVCHLPNGMFMRSAGNGSGNDLDLTLPSVLSTKNLELLAQWALME